MDKKPKSQRKSTFSKKDSAFKNLLAYLFVWQAGVNSQDEDVECEELAYDLICQIKHNLEHPHERKDINYKKYSDYMEKYNDINYIKNFYSFDNSAMYPLFNSNYGSLDHSLYSWYEYVLKKMLKIFDRVEEKNQCEHTINLKRKFGEISFTIKPIKRDQLPPPTINKKNFRLHSPITLENEDESEIAGLIFTETKNENESKKTENMVDPVELGYMLDEMEKGDNDENDDDDEGHSLDWY